MASNVYLVPSFANEEIVEPQFDTAAATVLQVYPVTPSEMSAKNTVGSRQAYNCNSRSRPTEDSGAAAAVLGFGIRSKPTVGDEGAKRVRCIWIGGAAVVVAVVLVVVVLAVFVRAGENGGSLGNTTTTPAPAPPVPAVQIDPEIQLMAPDAATGDGFGISVAVSGEVLVVGAHRADAANTTNRGFAYVYLLAGDGSSWTLQTILTPTDGTESHFFGVSVAVDGDALIVGAYGDDSNTGSAYVYIRLWNGWGEQRKLTASDGAIGDYFGESVSLSRDTIIVGAWKGDSTNGSITGKAYVYTRSGDQWEEHTILIASDGAADDHFGVSVAIDSDTIVVGASEHESVGGVGGTNRGAAYVYTRSLSEAGAWTQQTILKASDGAAGNYFGISVAIKKDTIVVGADYADNTATGKNESGCVYVYARSSLSSSPSQGGSSWTQQAKLTASDASTRDYFGASVAIEGDVIVVGAKQVNTKGQSSGSGRAYVYTRAENIWTEQAILTAIDGAQYDGFGESVAISGGSIVVGADEVDQKRGLVYIF